MNKVTAAIALLLLAALVVGTTVGCDGDGGTQVSTAPPGQEVTLEDEVDRQSYAFGYLSGQQMEPLQLDLQIPAFAEGLRDGLSPEAQPQLSQEELEQALMAFQTQMMERQQEMAQEQEQDTAQQAEENLEVGQAFLEQNREDEGVQVTDSGLQYKVLEEGTGASPGANDRVTVHYRGMLLDGTEFDSSYAREEPLTLESVDQVIPGWQEALTMMQEGGKWQLWIPPDLAYGERGSPPAIGPNEVLFFEVELLEVQEQPDSNGEAETEQP